MMSISHIALGIMLRFFLFLVFVHISLQVGQDHFFPYGNEAGDSSLTQGNDEYVELILPDDDSFPFYGDSYNDIYINTNGLITFGNAWSTPQTGQFTNTLPLHPNLDQEQEDEKITCAAPFWADVDTRSNRGFIYYRSTDSSSDLGRAASIVRSNFPSYAEYTANRVIVATWEDVSFFDHDTNTPTDPRNTFQAVLITDSTVSFVFFFYDKIEWTAGTTLNGNAATGIPEKDIHQAIVGFNKGDGLEAFYDGIPKQRMDLPLVSNINEVGSYAFQVNGEELTQAGCSNEVAKFVTYPPFGSILGGEKVNLYGPCWDGSDDNQMVCRFSNEAGETPVILQTVNGSVEDQNTAYCIPEPFFLVGEVKIDVSFDGGINYEKSGVYRILNLDRISIPENVTRDDAESSIWYTAGQQLGITWPTDAYPANTMVDIHILNYEEDDEHGPRWEKAFTIANRAENTGSRQFRTHGLDNITADNAFGVIRVQPSGDEVGVKLYSEIHPLGYLLENEFQDDPQTWAKDQCRSWAEEEDNKEDFVEHLESCPCTLDQALADTARFYSVLGCSMFNDNIPKCILNQGAKHCVMSIFPNDGDAGSKCCYDEQGNLMYAGDSPYGSTSQRAHVAGSFPYMEAGKVPSLSHFKYDIVPLFSCCLMDADCKAYLNRRPTADCYFYKSPKAAISFGDPHFITFDGSNYTFNGMGDYSLLHVGGSYEFKLEGRFEVIEAYSYSNIPQGVAGATGLTAAVMFENNANAIHVETSDVSGIEIYRGNYDDEAVTVSEWELINFRGQMWLDFPGVAVSINDVGDYSRVTSITVMFRNSRIGINITRGIHDNSFLAITPILPPNLMNDQTLSGLLGNWNNKTSDDFLDARGQELDLTKADPEEIYQYADSWKTLADGVLRTTYPKKYNESTYTAVLVPPKVGELTSSEQNTLNQICDTNEQCRFDYLVTRNRDIAADTKESYHGFEWGQNKTKKIPVCKFIPTPANGTKHWESKDPETGKELDTPNNFIRTIISFDCGDDLTLVGSSSRYCQKDGKYSGSEILNDCVATPCGTLKTVEYGSIEIEMNEGENAVARVTCDEGYALKGPSAHECVNGAWSGDKSICESSGGTNAAVVAGATVGAIFGVIIAVAVATLLFIFYKKQQTKPKTANPIYSPVESKDLGLDEKDKGTKSDDSYGYKDLEAKDDKGTEENEAPTPAPRSTLESNPSMVV